MEKDYSFIRKAFSKIGWAMLLMELSSNIAGLFISYFFEIFLPQYLDSFAYEIIMQIVPLYLIGMPVGCLVLSGMPVLKEKRGKLRLGRFISFFTIAMLCLSLGAMLSNGVVAIIELLTGVTAPDLFSEAMSAGNLWFNVFITVVAAPITEELFYRKLLIDRMSMFGEKQAIIVSSLIFALAHGNFYQVFYAFTIGMLFGYVYQKTGRISYTIGLHAMVNFFGGGLPTIVYDIIGNDAVTAVYSTLYSLFNTLIFAGGIMSFVFILRNISLKEGRFTFPGKKWRRYAYANSGMILFLIWCVYIFYLYTFM